MIFLGIALGIVLGLLAGGRLTNLASIRLRYIPLIAGAVIVRFATEAFLAQDVAIVEALRLPLLAGAFGLLLAGLWVNRAYPGLTLAFVGILANAVVIIANGGYMPIWEPSLTAAGFAPDDVSSAIHVILPPTLDANFLIHLGPLGDVIPIPLPVIRNVASIGDLFLTAGLAFFLFASVVRPAEELDDEAAERIRHRLTAVGASTRVVSEGLPAGLAEVSALDRPIVLGGQGTGLASPASAQITIEAAAALPAAATAAPTAAATATAATATALPLPTTERIRQHPYVRLALNGSFSALWAGQLISLFGDRIHQIGLAALVLYTTGSELATAMAFFFAALPNLFLSPVAGTFVDRWDRKEVLVVSDLLRAAVVLLIPLAAVVNILLVYPLIFSMTAISIFFRPARVAILPQLVDDDDLVTANSALWLGETFADIIGYPLAALFVAALATALPLAFWIDAATYLASAVMLATIVIRPAPPRTADDDEEDVEATGFINELRAGWAFLRRDTTLLANTVQAAVAQFSVGIMVALASLYAFEVFRDASIGWQGVWGFLETGIGAGNLIGGFAIGLFGSRIAKGRLIIAGYTAFGVLMFLLALTDHLGVAVGLALGSGIANMVFVIPSQALFQLRTPAALMGRVVSFRFALVFGSMTVAMGIGAILTEFVPPTTIIATFGLVTAAAGLAGLLVPAVRDA